MSTPQKDRIRLGLFKQALATLACTFKGHDLRVLRRMNTGARKVGCDRCCRMWAMHDDTRSLVPWDDELEALYAPGGPLDVLTDFAERSGLFSSQAAQQRYIPQPRPRHKPAPMQRPSSHPSEPYRPFASSSAESLIADDLRAPLTVSPDRFVSGNGGDFGGAGATGSWDTPSSSSSSSSCDSSSSSSDSGSCGGGSTD